MEYIKCPVCGSYPNVNQWSTTGTWQIECPRCCRGTAGLKSEEACNKFWNEVFVPRRFDEMFEAATSKAAREEITNRRKEVLGDGR